MMKTRIVILTTILLSQVTLAGTSPAKQSSERASTPGVEWVGKPISKFLNNLGTTNGEDALKSIESLFPIDASQRSILGAKIDALLDSLGPVEDSEVIGILRVSNSTRVAVLAAYSHHASGPALWEFTVYRTRESWQILKVRFSPQDTLERPMELGLVYSERDHVRREEGP